MSANFDVNLFRTESNLVKKLVKCVLVGSEWVTPTRLESMGGKGSAKNWQRSIICNKAPISSILDGSQQPAATSSITAGAALSATNSGSASTPESMLCCPILAFIKAARLRKDVFAMKKALIDLLTVFCLSPVVL